VAKGVAVLGVTADLFLTSPLRARDADRGNFCECARVCQQKICGRNLLLPGASLPAFIGTCQGQAGVLGLFYYGHAPQSMTYIAKELGIEKTPDGVEKGGSGIR